MERDYQRDLIGALMATGLSSLVGYVVMGWHGALLAGGCVFVTMMISKNL